jgi:hypothetical protein
MVDGSCLLCCNDAELFDWEKIKQSNKQTCWKERETNLSKKKQFHLPSISVDVHSAAVTVRIVFVEMFGC